MADATPAPSGLRYMPALDGLRAVAVVAVLLYHADVPWAAGGYFGVDAFFVLSGFLITSLLLVEWDRGGGIDLRAFWARRARRLLPALGLVLLAVVGYAAWVAQPVELRQLRSNALSTIGYVANWHQIFSEQSYFEQYAAPSPLRHTWSLAIEEQFYLVWPLLVLGVLRLRRGSVRALAGVCAVLAAGSAVWMAVLFDPGSDPSRVYYGTDTRVQSLAIGALLATIAARKGAVDGRVGRAFLHGAALGAAAVLALVWTTTSERDAWQYRGGFAATALLVAIVIASVTQPEHPGPLGAALSLRPVRWVGTISYGLYLWHWPVYVLLDEARTGRTGGALVALRLTVTLAVSVASYTLVERPIRHGAWRGWTVRLATPAAAVALVVAVVVATAGAVPPALREVQASELEPPEPRAARQVDSATIAEEPLRVMLVGDSVADSLSPGLERVAREHGFLLWNASVPGCGIATDIGDRWFAEWRGVEPRCLPGWRDRWPRQLAEFRPHVVVALFGAQDAFDRRIDGHVVRFDTPEGETLARAELGGALDTLSSTGARVLLLTTPYYRLGWPQRVELERSPLHEPWIDRYNAIQRDVAAARDGSVEVVDLNAFLNPGGTWTDTIDGVKVRSYDRSHLSPLGARVVARWLLPEVLQAGRAGRADAPAPVAARIRR